MSQSSNAAGFPDPIDVSPDSNLESEFHRFAKQWKLYAKSAGLDDLDPDRSKSTLLTAIGPECSKLYNHKFQLTPDDTRDCSTILAAIGRNLIDPTSSKLQRRADFNNQSRYENEPYFRFLRRLQQKLVGCYYGDIEDDVHLDKIISSINNEKLSLELCYMEELTLELAIERCLKEDKPAHAQATKPNSKSRPAKGAHKGANHTHGAPNPKNQGVKSTPDDSTKVQVGKENKNHADKAHVPNKKAQVEIGESSKTQATNLNKKTKPHAPKNTSRGEIPKKQQGTKSKQFVQMPDVKCLQCGNYRGLDHMANPTLCPAHGVQCKKCNEYNHLTTQCDARRGISSK